MAAGGWRMAAGGWRMADGGLWHARLAVYIQSADISKEFYLRGAAENDGSRQNH